ncbi:hypothetical protein [Bradyrhizobium sp. Ash2021]|jgi:hypothetical protein|uniref:hypothetical protein n=1 Tax=Bradyrhizobium sp. Ash2021 TaxID=2954771 RepID=UPI0028157FD2|nr:hypothetical protein [Bradyrhizobium sp. Ash2021]WMT75708.1 hypothetical protein NL528_04645 [Bradyrhizobium sp. Ash2021]
MSGTANFKLKFMGWVGCICLIPGIAFAGLTTAQRKSQFERALGLVISAVTPDMPVDERDRLIEAYMNGKSNKGLAVQDVYRGYIVSVLHEDEEAVGDRALEACQMRFAKPCALVAINDEIATDGQLEYKDMPRLHYAGDFDLSQIPTIRLDTRNRADLQRYFRASEPKAIAIHPWGELFISWGTADAQQTVLNKCNNFGRDKQNGPCFLYAINTKVVLPERITRPK